MIEPHSPEAVVAERLMGRQRASSREHAAYLADLSLLWVDRDDADLRDGREEMDLVAAIALRTTTSFAGSQLRDAHTAVTDFPETFALLGAGVMPVEWFDRLVRTTRALTPYQRGQIDERIATWELASIPADSYRRNLKQLVCWFTTREQKPSPQASRDVVLEPSADDDGTACMRLTGPTPELMAFTRRLDQSARAVQNQQRSALADGAPVPFDPEGEAAATGRPLTLAALQYAILTRSVLDTGAIEVPADRFQISMIVQAMTLMGHSDAPAMLDGIVPIPAEMARKLAAKQPDWYRVLTDPHTGAFLPLPAQKYRPTKAQLEYLRLVDPVCAMPGCDRPSSCNCEADHIDPFDHTFPALGGRTCITNLHLLCRTHHRLKTLGLLDVTRIPGLAAEVAQLIDTTTDPTQATPTGTAGPVADETDTPTQSSTPRQKNTAGQAGRPSPAGPSRASAPPTGSPPTTHPPGTSGPAPPRTSGPAPPRPPDPLDHPGGMITQWELQNSLRVQTAANRDLLTPELAAVLQDSWDRYMFSQEIHALIDNGEYERLARDATDIDRFHDYLVTTGELPDPDPAPPF